MKSGSDPKDSAHTTFERLQKLQNRQHICEKYYVDLFQWLAERSDKSAFGGRTVKVPDYIYLL